MSLKELIINSIPYELESKGYKRRLARLKVESFSQAEDLLTFATDLLETFYQQMDAQEFKEVLTGDPDLIQLLIDSEIQKD